MVNLKMTGKMKKILTLIAAMAAFVACSKVDITAPDADETQNREIKFNINVGGFGGPETKAVKTDWASGDKINIWFNCNYSQVPDLVMTYDGSAWSYGDLDDTVAPEDGQKFVAVYEGFNDLSQYDYVDYYFRSPSYYGGYNFPMVVCSKGTYEYSDDTITADLSAGWAFGTRLQVYVDGLSQEKPYGLSCSSLRPLTLFGPTEAGVFAFSKESGAGSVAQGVPFGEGVAFYFYDNYSGNGNSADYYFELIEYSAFGLPVSNRRYAVLGKTVTIDSKKCQGISITAGKFTGLLKNQSAALIVGENITLGITEGYPTDGLTWSSSNNDIATVDQTGKVTAVSEGTAVITVNNADGTMSDICEVTVNAIHVTSISLNATSISDLTVGSSSQLTATILPEYASNKSVTWTSSNTLVATVDNTGKVTALSEGSATITATTVDGGLSAICSVTVVPDIALKGVFSVSATKKVRFSLGNLQATYNGTDYTFGFAKNQYDYIGNAAGNTTINSQTSGAVVDLFGWSTDATNYGISTATSNSNYSGDFVDWGKNIGDGSTWRTLSKDEWTYLLMTRTNASKLYKYGITVCGKTNCLIIAPDGYTGTIAASYDASTWPVAEAAGLVCLPAADYRDGSVVCTVGGGYYWSSTDVYGDYAYIVFCDRSEVSSSIAGIRYFGYSVRLITDVEE